VKLPAANPGQRWSGMRTSDREEKRPSCSQKYLLHITRDSMLGFVLIRGYCLITSKKGRGYMSKNVSGWLIIGLCSLMLSCPEPGAASIGNIKEFLNTCPRTIRFITKSNTILPYAGMGS